MTNLLIIEDEEKKQIFELLTKNIEQNDKMLEALANIQNLKQQQIDNQQNFEGKWSRFKVFAAIAAIGTPLISLITGIIDPAVDFPVLAERATQVISQMFRFFGG